LKANYLQGGFDMDTVRAVKIAKLNDRFRGMALDVTITRGVIHGVSDVIGLLKTIECFDRFTEDNDPYGEHDFGSLTLGRRKGILENRLITIQH